MSTRNFICSKCGFDVPKVRSKTGVELWSGGVDGENARHVWEAGCMEARKRNAMLEEPDLVY